jgi:hypothetical protein
LTTQLPLDKFFGTLTAARGDPKQKDEDGENEEEESVYEQPTDQVLIHSVNCQELIGCSCTPKSESDRFAEERAAAIRRLHAGKNERARRAKSIRQLNSKPQQAQQDDWSPFPTMEDFEK